MTTHEFLNRLRSLYNIDHYLLPELTDAQWAEFLRDPPRRVGTPKMSRFHNAVCRALCAAGTHAPDQFAWERWCEVIDAAYRGKPIPASTEPSLTAAIEAARRACAAVPSLKAA